MKSARFLLLAFLMGTVVGVVCLVVSHCRSIDPYPAAQQPPTAIWSRKQPPDRAAQVARVLSPEHEKSRPPTHPPKLNPERVESAIRTFRGWVAEYIAAKNPTEKQSLLLTGKQLAVAHRQAIRELIPKDPQKALQEAVPKAICQQLPPEVVAELEERINIRAYYGVYATLPADPYPVYRTVETANKRYLAYVYGRRLTQPTTEADYIVGVAVDNLIAVYERPLRVLEEGERPDPAKPPSVIPADSVPTPDANAGESSRKSFLVEAGGTIYRFNSSGALAAFEQDLLAFEGATGGPVYPSHPVVTTASTGVRSVLYLRVAFPDVLLEPQTEAAAYDMMSQVNAWYNQSSYGRLYLLTTVSPLVVLPRTEAWYKNKGSESDLRDDALAVAKGMGYDGGGHDHIIFAYNGGPGSFNGLAAVGGKYVWLRSINTGTAAHELGHNLGLWHANFWDTGGLSVIGPGSNVEYGDSYDWMGGSRSGNGDFNAAWKNLLGWLPDEFIHDIHRSGTYRIVACDGPGLDPARRYAFKVRKDGQRLYWGEYRGRFDPSSTSLLNGILLHWSPWSQSASGTHLLDTTPGSPAGKNDAALAIGRTLSDFESGVHITPIGKGETSPDSIDVVVNIGVFQENRPPTITVAASQISVTPGTAVQATASAIDPDGDTLAFFWDFGDGSFSTDNLPLAKKTWSTEGRYVVRCVVSDMKGGTASDSVTVTVGAPSTFFISGRITHEGQGLANVRVHNGQSGSSYRGAMTDSHGNYTVTGLPAGGTTLSAVLFGYSFTATFNSPVTVGPDLTGADFTAQEAVAVSVATIDPSATEGADTATIRLSRTGPTTSALGVALASLQGPIRIEYSMNPEPGFIPNISDYGFLIPAGQSSLDVVITALKDGEIEGPETLTLEIRSAASYVISGPPSASVVFYDADSPLPLVSADVLDSDANEAGDTATFVISRVGSTANDLTVRFNLSGGAVNGIDYAAVDSSVVIPAGQSSTSIVIAPLSDTAVEGIENVVLTLSAEASYLVSPTASEARAFIGDQNLATVSISVTDATASETGQDPATFVVSRTGDTSAPLTVDYALSGTAQHGVDYAVLPGRLTIPAGANAASLTVVPIDDDIGEAAQTVAVRIRAGEGYAVGSPNSGTATISDNDVPVVTVGVSDATFAEPTNSGQFKFTTTGSGSGNITVHYTVTGTATPGVDYAPLSGSLSMGRNGTATVTVTPLDDSDSEDLETVTVTIDPDPAYTTFLDKSATLNLLDDERPIVNVVPAAGSLNERGGGTMRFYISRQGSTASPLIVNYAMSGTASNGLDYVALPGTAVIAAGQTGVSVDALLIDDLLAEGTETATLTLTPDSTYGLGIARATQYIADDEALPITLGFGSSTGRGSEDIGLIKIPVTLSAASTNRITVEYSVIGGSATGGIDYDFAPGILTFPPGVTSTNLVLTIIDDIFEEPDQSVIIALTNAWGAALGVSSYTFTIVDNDTQPPVSVGFAAATSAASHGVSPALLVVSLSATQAIPVTVHYTPTGGTAIDGKDYTLTPGTVTFAPGESVEYIPITISNTTLSEPTKTIIVTLDSPSGAVLNANTMHTYSITNLPGTLAVTPDDGLSGSGFSGGPFVPWSLSYTLRNVGDAALDWTASKTQGWVGLSATTGSLAAGASTNITVSINSNADSLAAGSYNDTVSFVNTTIGDDSVFRGVQLTVSSYPVVLAGRWLDSGYFQVVLTGQPLGSYVIEASTNFTDWTRIVTNTASADGTLYSESAQNPARFFRARPLR